MLFVRSDVAKGETDENSHPTDAAWQAAKDQLHSVRTRILAGEVGFADAARANSQSPSAENGGALGRFEYHGSVTEEISRVAFALKPGEISQPFRTRSAVHLVRVSARIPGQLSLEDARPELINVLARQMWSERVQRERDKADIQLLESSEAK